MNSSFFINRFIKSTLVGLIALLTMNAYSAVSTFDYRSAAEPQKQPHVAFVLFYMAKCPHCQRFDPILKQYARSHDMDVLAYTLDGKPLPSFPNSQSPTEHEMRQFFPEGNPVVPTVFLMNLDQHRIYPLLKGEATFNQLDERVHQIIKMSHSYG